MRTVTTTTEVFTFDELSDDAKGNARDWWRESSHGDDSSATEWRDIFKKAAEVLPIKVGRWEVSTSAYSFCEITVPEDNIAELSGARAWKWFQNHGVVKALGNPNAGDSCPFTGFCGDEDFLDPLRAFLKLPDDRTIAKLMQECADGWVKGYVADLQDQDSDEYIDEVIAINEYEFTRDGHKF